MWLTVYKFLIFTWYIQGVPHKIFRPHAKPEVHTSSNFAENIPKFFLPEKNLMKFLLSQSAVYVRSEKFHWL